MKNKKSLLRTFKARPFWTVLIVAINMAFVVTACSGAAGPTTIPATMPTTVPTTIPATQPPATQAPTQATEAPPATEAPTATVANLPFPTGKFINSKHPDHGLIFNKDGTSSAFETSSGGSETTIAEGNYTVKGNIFTDTPKDPFCPPMSFKYIFDGTYLTFNYVGDPAKDTCFAGRGLAFDNVTYTLSVEASFPTGKFIKSGTADYGLMFNDDGTFQAFKGSNVFVHATYSVNGDTLTEKTSEHGCPDVPRSFKYKFDGTNLTFNYIGDPADDPCTARRGDFNNVTYRLVK